MVQFRRFIPFPFHAHFFYRNVAIIKSNKDTRYGLDSIVTHDGMKLPCWAIPNLSSFKKKFGQGSYDKVSYSPSLYDANIMLRHFVNKMRSIRTLIKGSKVLKSMRLKILFPIRMSRKLNG